MKRLAKWAVVAGALLALGLAAAAAAQAEGFTGADVLKWDRDSQAFYFKTSVTMAGVIASQNNRDQAQCVDQWYGGQSERRDEAIRDAMRTYPTYHPQAVILWVLQEACTSFKYR